MTAIGDHGRETRVPGGCRPSTRIAEVDTCALPGYAGRRTLEGHGGR
ncbi:hypothetical protein SCATT_02370 [Streptantibioticus cattleyicolor NRRL 8057 = DSM 46488]|uniref:Uncharacterized protein n=1 Tax=Streptantibioticus cattleyicolor (strain ATCC 35852 / DSM 46488 / JCM 4925 / NBRC 14057 / NRRL 8057) TaxID=1003195 RepID=G8WMN9_STREN|nr:hypothetical protein SCATT_02370 [Streptantibioticus cattleyicolor NRRL 8057 = DSM 46488]